MTAMATENSKSQFKGLPTDVILGLMQNTRTRNAYGPKLLDFMENSDEAGINPVDIWPVEFGGKEAATLYQGFMKAVKDAELSDTIKVIRREDSVFILHLDRVSLALNADSEENATEDE